MRTATSRVSLIAALLLAIAPGVGSAQGWRAAESRGLLTAAGEYVLAGGGFTDFTSSAAKDRFRVGGTWDVRLGLGSRYWLGGELAYVGSSRNGDGFGSDLSSNGAEGVLRLQYPYALDRWLVEPFAFGGLGWSHLTMSHAAPGLKGSDDYGLVPFGAGVTAGYRNFLLDARFTYRATFGESLKLAANEGSANLDQWALGLSVGYEF